MRLIQLTLIFLVLVTALSFVTAGQFTHPAQWLPFFDGEPKTLYTGAGIVTLLIFCWGLTRLNRSQNDDE